MTTLDVSAPDELRLTLRGEAENCILMTLRRWPYWLRAELEPDPADAKNYLTVTLITSRTQEATLREILQRGFGIVFPREGGSTEFVPPPPSPSRRGKVARRF